MSFSEIKTIEEFENFNVKHYGDLVIDLIHCDEELTSHVLFEQMKEEIPKHPNISFGVIDWKRAKANDIDIAKMLTIGNLPAIVGFKKGLKTKPYHSATIESLHELINELELN